MNVCLCVFVYIPLHSFQIQIMFLICFVLFVFVFMLFRNKERKGLKTYVERDRYSEILYKRIEKTLYTCSLKV